MVKECKKEFTSYEDKDKFIMSTKIEIKNVYKIFGENPSKSSSYGSRGGYKRGGFRKNGSHSWS